MTRAAEGLPEAEPKLALQLLNYCAATAQCNREPETLSQLSEFNGGQVEWALRAGLGALLFHATRGQSDVPIGDRRNVLLSAELTSRIRYALIVDTTLEVLEACERAGTAATLLKGISISDQCYPTPHVRTMGDVDVLISRDAYESVEALLLARGYRRSLHRPPDGYHGYPLLNTRNRVWVELHLALYPNDSGLMEGRTFCLANVEANSVDSTFHGIQVKRLGIELQLAYIASSWIRDLTINGVAPGFLMALIDAIFLQKSWQEMNGTRLLNILDNEIGRSSVYVMTSYLERHRLGQSSVLAELARREGLVRPLELRAIHACLDRYLLAGREWNIPLPLPVPGRYNFKRQFRKRFLVASGIRAKL